TRLDILDELPSVRICVGYEVDGRRTDFFPARTDVLERCRPLYEDLPGWQARTASARSWDDLPAAARDYVGRLSELLALPVALIGVGEAREQTIVLDESLLPAMV